VHKQPTARTRKPALSFNYQKARLAKGEIKLPETPVPLSSFGQGAKYAGSDQR
jgi:hypothetical protein